MYRGIETSAAQQNQTRVTRRQVRAETWRETGRRAAECAAVGLLITAFSLPLVTAGAAWIAAATVFDAWTRDEEPRLLQTFLYAVRTRWRAGLVIEVAVLALAAVGYFDARFAWAAAVPGARVEVAALIGLVAVAAGLILLTVARLARTGQPLRTCVREAVTVATQAPWTLVVLALAGAVCVALVLIVPAFVLLIGGPLGFAVSMVHARATAGETDPVGGAQ